MSKEATVTSNEIQVSRFVGVLYAQDNQGNIIKDKDNNPITIKEIDNRAEYGNNTTIYAKEAAKGKNKGATLYAVAASDFIPKKRVSASSIKESMLADFMSGMTPDQIKTKYNLDVQ